MFEDKDTLCLLLTALFTSRLVGRPGNYLYVFESYRMEEVKFTLLYIIWEKYFITTYWR